jgi:hypothetical protein
MCFSFASRRSSNSLLDGGSAQNVRRWLNWFCGHGFVDRRRVHVSGPYAFAISNNGARLLKEEGHRINDALDWREKNRRASDTFIEHTLEIGMFMNRLEVACQSEGIELLRESDILADAPEATRRAREPRRWQVSGAINGKQRMCSVIPDRIFGLGFPDDTASYFLLEIDRGTIPHTRADVAGMAQKHGIQVRHVLGWLAKWPA